MDCTPASDVSPDRCGMVILPICTKSLGILGGAPCQEHCVRSNPEPRATGRPGHQASQDHTIRLLLALSRPTGQPPSPCPTPQSQQSLCPSPLPTCFIGHFVPSSPLNASGWCTAAPWAVAKRRRGHPRRPPSYSPLRFGDRCARGRGEGGVADGKRAPPAASYRPAADGGPAATTIGQHRPPRAAAAARRCRPALRPPSTPTVLPFSPRIMHARGRGGWRLRGSPAITLITVVPDRLPTASAPPGLRRVHATRSLVAHGSLT